MKGRRKKLTALFLCVVFIAALTACAENKGAVYEPSLSGENKVDENTEETCRQTGCRYSSSPVSSWFRRSGMNKSGQG